MQNQEDLDSHVKSHSNILICETCGEKFAHQWQLDIHDASQHAKTLEDQDTIEKQ